MENSGIEAFQQWRPHFIWMDLDLGSVEQHGSDTGGFAAGWWGGRQNRRNNRGCGCLGA